MRLPLLTLLPAVVTAFVTLRAADLGTQVRSQIDNLNASVIELTSAVTAFDGTLLNVIPQSLAVVVASSKVDIATVKTTWLSEASGNFTAEESSSIVTTLATLITPINAVLGEIEAKYPLFKKNLEAPLVLLNLKTLKSHTDDLVLALGKKVTAQWGPFLTLGQGLLDAAFDKAISAYSA